MNLSSKLLRICTGVQAAAIIAISMPVSTSYAAAPDPNWHVVKTQYKTDDYVMKPRILEFPLTAELM